MSILTRNGYYKKAQLKDQLPEVASILSRKIPKCARKIIKHPIKMRGRKLVRALFRDCSALEKFSGKHKLFVRLPNKTVRFVAPYGRFTISFGEQQYAKYSAVFFANSWNPIFCNIDTFAGSSNLVGYVGVKQVNGFILDSVWSAGNKFYKVLVPGTAAPLVTILPGLRVRGNVGWVPQQYFSFINCKLPFYYSKEIEGDVNTLTFAFRPFTAIDGVVQWGS